MSAVGFINTYECTMDDKGRMRIPAKFREQLGEGFIISHGFGGCLSVYPTAGWLAHTKRIYEMDEFDDDVMNYRRTVFPNAVEGEFDAAGRVLIGQRQRKYAELVKELVAVGMYDHFEIWPADKWNENNFDSSETRRKYQKKVSAKVKGE